MSESENSPPRRGRKGLRECTGQDFGYDLAAWHEYLLTHDDGYAHPYARWSRGAHSGRRRR